MSCRIRMCVVLSVICDLLAFLPIGTAGAEKPALSRGRELFLHRWEPNDIFFKSGDGLGPVFNAVSCVACHFQGGIGGGGGSDNNVQLIMSTAEGNAPPEVLHRFGNNPDYAAWRSNLLGNRSFEKPKKFKTLLVKTELPIASVFTGDVLETKPDARRPFFVDQRNTPALFGAGLINAISENAISAQVTRQSQIPGPVKGRKPSVQTPGAKNENAKGFFGGFHSGRFGWRGQTAQLRDFVLGACANELGLEVPGHNQPFDPLNPSYRAPDFDLTSDQCESLVAFVASLPRPQQIMPENVADLINVERGEELFRQVGCAQCHVRQLDNVDGIYSDLLLHDMGPELIGVGIPIDPPGQVKTAVPNTPQPVARSLIIPSRGIPSNPQPSSGYHGSARQGISPQDWKTPPLWGVRDSAPYLHDGRAQTLMEAIEQHGGEAAVCVEDFHRLSVREREYIIMFLKTLAAPQGAMLAEDVPSGPPAAGGLPPRRVAHR